MPDKKEEINTQISAVRARCAEPGKEYREHRAFGVLGRCLRYDTQDRNSSRSRRGQLRHRTTLIISFAKDGVSNSGL